MKGKLPVHSEASVKSSKLLGKSLCVRTGVRKPGSVFNNHDQERSLSFSPRLANLNVTQRLIG